jgi:toxin secretion/phage lysis holin
MDKKLIFCIIAVAVIVGIFTFIAGYAAGSLMLAKENLVLKLCKDIFSPTASLAIACYLLAAALDVCTGVIKSSMKGTFNSSDMRKGLWKKAATIGIICATSILAAIMYFMGITCSMYLVIAVCAWFGAMEVGSNFENAGECGVPIPSFLRRSLKILQQEVDSKVPAVKEEQTGSTDSEDNTSKVDNK